MIQRNLNLLRQILQKPAYVRNRVLNQQFLNSTYMEH